MKITLRNNKIDSIYNDNKDISNLSQSVVVIPVDIYNRLHAIYVNAGYNVDNGFNGLPNPKDILIDNDLLSVKIATAQYNRQIRENIGVAWGNYKFKTDTKTCSSLLGVISGINSGLTSLNTVEWRDKDGKFFNASATDLQSILAIVMPATEVNFSNEKQEIYG